MPSQFKKSFAAEQRKLRPKKKTGLWIFLAVVGIVVVVGGYALYSRFAAVKNTAPEKEKIKSIAVLPFADLSPEKDQGHLGDGIADEIINDLSHVNGLRVIDRTSSFEFRGKEEAIDEIGRKLDVEWVLEGSIKKAGNKLRITAQLINVKDHSHIFSEEYDRELEDILTTQDEISLEVVRKLKVKLLEKEIDAIRKRYTKNPKAYDLYLKGRNYWRQRNPESFKTALSYYRQAIEIDPDYALAVAGIADVYNLMGLHGGMPTKDAFTEAKKWAQKALQIDDTLAEAYNSLAYATLYLDWNWNEAERLFKTALEINPYYALAHWWYKDYLLIMGRGNEARDDILQALERDPLNGGLYGGIIVILFSMGRCDDMLEEIQNYSKIYPENTFRINYHKGRYYICTGDYEKAIETLQFLRNTRWVFLLGYAYAKSGDADNANQILQQIIKEKYISGLSNELMIAAIYSGLGDNDKAFEWLDKAYEEHVHDLPTITLWPYFESLRSDPRYTELMKKMGIE